MKDRILDILQRVGRAFMLPIAILPVAGILLGLGSSMTDPLTITAYNLQSFCGEGTNFFSLFKIMQAVGKTIFDNLPFIFAVGTAIGMAKKEKEVAALSAAIAYMVMISAVNACLTVTGQILPDGEISPGVLNGTIVEIMGIQTLQMGVFGGIVVGLGVAFLHNRFRTISFPNIFSFFSGKRFIPIISTLVYLCVGILMFFIWPTVQHIFYVIGGFVENTGYIGTLFYGLVKRALIPFGLHHVFYFPFWHTAVGGSMQIAGHVVEGGQNIFFAQLADPTTTHFSAEACRFFSGEFIFMIFGLPGAALAIYDTAKPENKKKTGGLLLSAALTCLLTGITEPIEFSFLFTAPILFFVHVVFAAMAYMIAHLMNIAVGLTFSGGLIDFVFFGIMQGNEKTNWIWVIPLGLIYFGIYYIVFRYLILKYNLKTPGREDNVRDTLLYSKEDLDSLYDRKEGFIFKDEKQRAELIVMGLGGKDNILDADCCATRLRCILKDKKKIDNDILLYTGSNGFYHMGNGIQIIYGPQVIKIKRNLDQYLELSEIEKKMDGTAKKQDKNAGQSMRDSKPERDQAHTSDRHVEQSTVFSPLSGKAVSLSEIDDLIFSSEILGKGCAVLPSEGKVYSPLDGWVYSVFDSNHAISLLGKNGEEVLIHIGLNTVKLRGEGFTRFVEKGEAIKKGELIMEFDRELITSKGYSLITPVVISNTDNYSEIFTTSAENVRNGDALLSLK